ncbi:type VI secretion system-associated FHA domain protein TagH [Rhodanobacter sp. DHB23]|nr:type VI secretion system-associated FHA domain protein TagH [Rhodanobacter sp. DHB23]MBD8871355.1 type VI secretion system-associated FHA domain protein TagH [Rhodanobacter sp. DHB23]
MQTLTLAVLGQQAAQFGSRSQRSFPGSGGSIGRSEDCDWVLGAPGVSRIHAMVRCLNGVYFIEDRSTNGMLLNGAPMPKGEPSALKEGDRLQIDTFEISVQLQAPAAPAPAPAPAAPPVAAAMSGDPLLDFGLSDLLAPASAPVAAAGPSLIPDAAGVISGDLDPLSFLDAPYAPAAAPAAPQSEPIPSWNHTAGMADHFRPPITDVQRQAQMLPEDWDLTMGDLESVPEPAAGSAPPVAAPAAPPVAPPIAPPPAAPFAAPAAVPVAATGLPPELEQILHIVADGVMDVLRARAEIKNTFRLPVTIIQRSENNPLKFAPTPDEAVQRILAPTGPAFLSGGAAFQDAFEDIRCHQMAMLAGVRAAFESLLVHFNPDRFEHEADGGAKRAAFGGKGRYWDRYREHFEELMGNPDECFRRLFGDEFARAYEEQLARLKSALRAGQARRP